MAWEEEDWVPISALQHFAYCPRQCALIHVEQTFDENLFTLRGRRLHEHVDLPGEAVREGIRVERSLPLWSERLGLFGKADVLELPSPNRPYPLEYKSGPRRARRADEIQLCAQAMCLEEMLGVSVPAGAIYHHASRRRREVVFTEALRQEVEEATRSVRALMRSRQLPPPVADARCRDCSLLDACIPFALRALPGFVGGEPG